MLRTRRSIAERTPSQRPTASSKRISNNLPQVPQHCYSYTREGLNEAYTRPRLHHRTHVQLQAKERLGLVPEDFIGLDTHSYPAAFKGSSGDGKRWAILFSNGQVTYSGSLAHHSMDLFLTE